MTRHDTDIAGVTGLAGVCAYLAFIAALILQMACGQIARPEPEPFYAETAPPAQQEFRWSNGGEPKTLDPAMAAAAPETDLIRAVFEGLTDLDAKTLEATPGVAKTWETTDDGRTWTFHLREDARWSNGIQIQAKDFVRSWKRLARLGPKAANNYLFQNIVGMRSVKADVRDDEPTDFLHSPAPANSASEMPPVDRSTNAGVPAGGDITAAKTPQPQPATPAKPDKSSGNADSFGAVAIDELTLKVSLTLPDPELPKLLANPIFSPVFDQGDGEKPHTISTDTVTNGPFRIAGVGDVGVALERSEQYWNQKAVGLERIRFVPMSSAEEALDAYRAGDLDAVTNANFEPLAIKLLAPYDDFKRTTHSALNFYEVNHKRAPYTDRRVREALAISIDRDRLTQSELEGSVQPAHTYLPLAEGRIAALSLDVERARDLLDKAGYPDGKNFRTIRLVVNRNETQQRVAKAVARMWKQNLNLETEITVKETSEMDDVRRAGEFDLIRRGAVMPTTDELVSLMSVFGELPPRKVRTEDEHLPAGSMVEPKPDATLPMAERPSNEHKTPMLPFEAELPVLATKPRKTADEEHAVFSIYAIPLYFPTSYSLVKPYVRGFEINGLDAPSLKEVSIDNNWQPR